MEQAEYGVSKAHSVHLLLEISLKSIRNI